MRIEKYFEEAKKIVDDCPVVQSSNLTFEKRSSYEGFIQGELVFVDGSILHFREFVDVESIVERLMYVYHYINGNQTFGFRYDNTGHHRKRNIPTYPHHKHIAGEEILPSSGPDLQEVMEEIQDLISLP